MKVRRQFHLTAAVMVIVPSLALAMATVRPQNGQAVNARRLFDVVSIRPNVSGDIGTVINQPSGALVARSATLRMVLRLVYRSMQDYQIIGGPDWMNTDRFDIQAKPSAPLPINDWAPATLAMLEDRFQLKLHHEMRELSVFLLTVDKGGPKMEAVERPKPGEVLPALSGRSQTPNTFTPPPGAVRNFPGRIVGEAIQMRQLADTLSRLLTRPVIDSTNLSGTFRVQLQFSPDSVAALAVDASPTLPQQATDPSGPTLFTALQEQLGLRLVTEKRMVEVLVIDSVQKPSEN